MGAIRDRTPRPRPGGLSESCGLTPQYGVHQAQAAAGRETVVTLETDRDLLARYLEDAAHYPGGAAVALARPATLEQVTWTVRRATALLAVGAQSSLTGGATPAHDTVLSTERLTTLSVGRDTVVAGAGVTLLTLQDALRPHHLWFPPVPTYLGATVGGIVATNAAGAATFKYGPVRPWVRGLTVVLADGDVLRLRRGDVCADAAGRLTIATSSGVVEVRVPDVQMPQVPKCAAGYFAAPHMDLVDLFIGSEGTLGVVVEAELAVRPRPPGVCWLLIPLASEAHAIALTGDLRADRALDVAAIEHVDARAIEVLRADGVDTRLGITIPSDAAVLLLAQFEVGASEAQDALSDGTLAHLMQLLDRYGAADTTEVVLPGQHRRAAELIELREAVPAGVNRRVAEAHARDPRVHKTAADMIVPFDRFAEMLASCRTLARRAQLDLAVWGHISDGNVHPNVIPQSYDDVVRGQALILELADQVIALGGSPLAEHGVGRNRVKQRLLQQLYGPDGIEAMRAVKRALDPEWKLAAGVLFERIPNAHAR